MSIWIKEIFRISLYKEEIKRLKGALEDKEGEIKLLILDKENLTKKKIEIFNRKKEIEILFDTVFIGVDEFTTDIIRLTYVYLVRAIKESFLLGNEKIFNKEIKERLEELFKQSSHKKIIKIIDKFKEMYPEDFDE